MPQHHVEELVPDCVSELAVVAVLDVLHAPVVPVVPVAAGAKTLAIHVRELVRVLVLEVVKVLVQPAAETVVMMIVIVDVL